MALKSKATQTNLEAARKTLNVVTTLSEADSAAGNFSINPLNDLASNAISTFKSRVEGEIESLECKLTNLDKAKRNVWKMSDAALKKYIEKEADD